jgi:hypothetical protein
VFPTARRARQTSQIRLMRLGYSAELAGVETNKDRIVVAFLLVGERQHDRFGDELERSLGAARRIGFDLIDFEISGFWSLSRRNTMRSGAE